MEERNSTEAALQLLRQLDEVCYAFTPVTPATHARVIGRAGRHLARNVRDVLGWSLPFAPSLLPAALLQSLEGAGLLERAGPLLKAKVRVARVRGRLFLHSAFPTVQEDAVFLGPDTLRFVDHFLSEINAGAEPTHIVDLGAGAGVGGILAKLAVPAARVTLVDVNSAALKLAEVNARYAGAEVETLKAPGLKALRHPYDLVLANPPFIIDEKGPRYRNGGDHYGCEVSLEWALCAAASLPSGGRMLMYTGTTIVGGRDRLAQVLSVALPKLGCDLRYREIDPDIFGEELEQPAYADVERIAAVGLVITRR